MATYKVPQDVEAEDRLLGPFTFRQFVYLLIAAIAGALAAALFQIFPLLAILPLPVIIFFLILALPLKKDQPMETYLAAIVSFYMKPNKHLKLSRNLARVILVRKKPVIVWVFFLTLSIPKVMLFVVIIMVILPKISSLILRMLMILWMIVRTKI